MNFVFLAVVQPASVLLFYVLLILGITSNGGQSLGFSMRLHG
jgi:hypothetical protein